MMREHRSHDSIENATTVRSISGEMMTIIIRFLIVAGLLVGSLSSTPFAQTLTVIPDSEAAQLASRNEVTFAVQQAIPKRRF
jgi:hypothetical protein